MRIVFRSTESLAETAWMALFVLAPFVYSSQVYDGALLPKLLVFQILAVIFFGICLRRIWRDRSLYSVSPILLPLFLYLLLASLSVAYAVNRIESVLQLAHYVGLALIPLAVFCTLSPSGLLKVFRVAAWVGVPISLIGLAQYFGWGIGLFGWNVYDIPSNANPSATFFHRNAAAEYLIGILPLAWIGFRMAQNSRTAVAHAVLLALLGTYLIYTRTRGAWVGLAGAILIVSALAYLSRREGARLQAPPQAKIKRNLLVVALVIISLGAALPEDIQKTGNQRFDEKKANTLSAVVSIVSEHGHRGRFALWRYTLNMIRDYPFGVGLGNWQYIYPIYARGDHVNVTASPSRPHNDLLWIAAEVGLPGLLAYLAILFVAGRLCWDLLRVPDFPTRTAALGLAVVVLAHLGDGMFNFPRERLASACCFWFGLGAIARIHADRFPNPAKYPRRPLILAAGLGIILLLTGLGITIRRLAYDRHHLRVFYGERSEDWNTVIDEAQNASEHGSLRANTFIALGRAFYRTGDLSGAQSAYETALRLHPNSLNAYNNIGIVYRRTGQFGKAIVALEKALHLYPGFPEATVNLGHVYRDMGRPDDAIATYRKALGQESLSPQIHYNLGKMYHRKGDLLRAQNSYLNALNSNPNYAPARRALMGMGVSETALPPSKNKQETHDEP